MNQNKGLLSDINMILSYSDIEFLYNPVFDIPTGRTLDYERVDDFDILSIAKHIEKELSELYDIKPKHKNKSNRHWNRKRRNKKGEDI